MRRALFLTLLSCTLLLSPGISASAASTNPPKDKGLLITPLRQFTNLNAGSQKTNTFTIANLNATPLAVNLSLKQFSVSDYFYNYQFSTPQTDWLKLGVNQVTLQPSQSRNIPYTIAVPAGTAPGGHYYTLFASATVSTNGLSTTVQAATLVYLTVNGQLVKTSSLHQSSMTHFTFSKNVNFSLDPVNTGNVYYFIYITGQLRQLWLKSSAAPATHILYPNKVRLVGGSIPLPPLPGLYHASYGYRTDSNQTIIRSGYVLYIPPWFIAFILAAAVLFGKFHRKNKAKPSGSSLAPE